MYRSISAWTAGDGRGELLAIFFFAFLATLEYLLSRIDDIVHVCPADGITLGDHEPPPIEPKHHAVLPSLPYAIEEALQPSGLDHDFGFA